ncbi:MAG: hypothetical protein PF488_00160 [Patescibacteria group bacterium]|nr:hypothetical protein [Patescibacteria group bacterium]
MIIIVIYPLLSSFVEGPNIDFSLKKYLISYLLFFFLGIVSVIIFLLDNKKYNIGCFSILFIYLISLALTIVLQNTEIEKFWLFTISHFIVFLIGYIIGGLIIQTFNPKIIDKAEKRKNGDKE